MAAPHREQLLAALHSCQDPHSEGSLGESAELLEAVQHGDTLEVRLRLPYPAAGAREMLCRAAQQALEALPEVAAARVSFDWHIAPGNPSGRDGNLAQVKHLIAVASGKGGVGKSTTAVNLAVALVQEGARTGILDADIYGPSQQIMLGIPEGTRPEVRDRSSFVPVPAHGLQTMSMGYLATAKTPMVWRGPMASGALQQMLTQTCWGELDYLVVDLPPGTGDVPLTLAQKAPLSGAVIVTTPQDIALLDARKGIELFRKVQVPILGVVENMSFYQCSHCGQREPLFGAGGGERIAAEYGVRLLASLPLDAAIRAAADGGQPSAAGDKPDSAGLLYREAARRLAAQLAMMVRSTPAAAPTITVTDT